MRPIIVLAVVLLGVGALYARFPYALDDSDTVQRLIYLVILLLIILLSGGRIRRELHKKAFRDGAIWLGIILLLVFSYSFRDMFTRRITGELFQQQAIENGDGSIEVRASEGGHYFMEARVNNIYVRFMVDTGASDIVLSPKDAARAGIAVDALSYDKSYSTANGFGSGANVVLDTVKVGSYTFSKVAASVNKEQMSESLLGMSFLKQFKAFHIEDNRLVLIP